MLSLEKIDRAIYKNRDVVKEAAIILFGISVFNSLIWYVMSITLLKSDKKKPLPFSYSCQVLPTAEFDFQQGAAEATEDYMTSGNYNDVHDYFAFQLAFTLSTVLLTPLIQLFLVMLTRPLSFTLVWPIVQPQLILPYFIETVFREETLSHGYYHGFSLACLQDRTKPGCRGQNVRFRLQYDIDRVKEAAAFCTYNPNLYPLKFLKLSTTIFYLLYILMIIAKVLEARLNKVEVIFKAEHEAKLESIAISQSVIESALLIHSHQLKEDISFYTRAQSRIDRDQFPEYFCPLTNKLIMTPFSLNFQHADRNYHIQFEHTAYYKWWFKQRNNRELEAENWLVDPINNIKLLEVSNLELGDPDKLAEEIVKAIRDRNVQQAATPLRNMSSTFSRKRRPSAADVKSSVPV